MSFKAWVIGRGKDKRDTVKNLALHFICNNMQHVLEELFRNGKEGRGGGVGEGRGGWVEGWAGGTKVIPATTPGGKAMESALGYGCHQRLGYGASHESLAVAPTLLLSKLLSIMVWSSGPSIDSGHARLQCAFWCEHMNEVFSVERAAQEYAIMLNNRVRFRAVLCIFSHCQGACC